jgi:hypothetical protein
MSDKTFPFEVGGTAYHLKKLDLAAKESILDELAASRLAQVERMYQKRLFRNDTAYLSAKQAAFVKWGSEAMVADMSEPEMQLKFVRACLVEQVDDATLVKLMESKELAAAMKRMKEDDDPKARTGGPTTTPPG